MDPDTEPVQDKVVWFSDGNIVLRAEQTLFRVYAGILSQASPIFRDMLFVGKSQSNNPAETYEGCPLVVMAGDSATDMRTFLRVLHDFSTFQMRLPTLDDLSEIISLLRLSTKYEVLYFRQRTLEALQTWYPSTVSGFEELQSSEKLRLDLKHHIEVANVAKEALAWILLPSALLHCAIETSHLSDLYDGMTLSDGSRVALLPEHKRAIILGRPKLELAYRTETFAFLYLGISRPLAVNCYSRSTCPTFCQGYLERTSRSSFTNPFSLFSLCKQEATNARCCQMCIAHWETANKKSAEALWERLPSLFELYAWDHLQAMTDSGDSSPPASSSPPVSASEEDF